MPSPSVWGTVFHDCLMFIALSYPENPSKAFKERTESFLLDFMDRLPCKVCRVHARRYLALHPLNLDGTNAFVTFLVDMHNDINARQNKKSDWTKEVAIGAFYKRHYSNFSAINMAEFKRLEDHALLRQVAEGSTCSCKAKAEVQKFERERAIPIYTKAPPAIVIEKRLIPESWNDIAWFTLLSFTCLLLFLVIYLCKKVFLK